MDELVRQDTVQPCRAAAGTQVIADRFKQRIIGGGAGQLEVNVVFLHSAARGHHHELIAAVQALQQFAQPGDVVLIAGKGHEDYQEIEGVKHHFDDKEEVEKLFAEERI